jgi:hypothetical protein
VCDVIDLFGTEICLYEKLFTAIHAQLRASGELGGPHCVIGLLWRF